MAQPSIFHPLLSPFFLCRGSHGSWCPSTYAFKCLLCLDIAKIKLLLFLLLNFTYMVWFSLYSVQLFSSLIITWFILTNVTVKVKTTQLWLTLCDSVDCAGIFQARIPEWVAYPFSSRSSQLRNQTEISCIAGKFFTNWATREASVRVGQCVSLLHRIHHGIL